MKDQMIVGLGEILWDLLPDGRQLGGALFNFTFHCHQLGHPATIVSRVGADDLGRAIRAELCQRGLSDVLVQEDSERATGTVTVAVEAGGQPGFTIAPDVAWDYLAWNDRIEALFARAAAVCFGTLVQRHEVARATVRQALAAARDALIICDINLRQHFYDREVIERSLHASRWLKLNDDELAKLCCLLGLAGITDSELLAELRRDYGLELACVTYGADGCLVQTATEEIAVQGEKVHVVDTIGAGDAFTAGLLVLTLEGRSVAEAVRFANRFASRVAAAAGGTPRIDRSQLE